MDSVMWRNMYAECMEMKVSGHFQDIISSFKNVLAICSSKGIQLRIDFSVCPAVNMIEECSPCSQLLMMDEGIKPCFESLSEQLQRAILADCNSVVDDQAAYDKLLNNLAVVCSQKGIAPLETVSCITTELPSTGTTSGGVNPPVTGTSVHPVTQSTTEIPTGNYDKAQIFVQPCFEAISGQLQQAIVADCNAVISDEEAYNGLLANLALICNSKGKDVLSAVPCLTTELPSTGTTSGGVNPPVTGTSVHPVTQSTTEFPTVSIPPVDCDPCNFGGNSCFESITGQLQHAIVADCNAVSADNEGYDRLLKNLALICSGKRLETLKAVTCDQQQHISDQVKTQYNELKNDIIQHKIQPGDEPG
ncbi:hypothetical protein LSH36_109g00033 [Paralvinella palmiformis]|uniref:Uncharacterized protein n=1 Tax=Paralvinella palmiformis TaxID=53620 RepID=A0AAD9JZW6_9ANNE|nr:hypothetical protein LSH36_109g00033 [Paralvinella palmiformis]